MIDEEALKEVCEKFECTEEEVLNCLYGFVFCFLFASHILLLLLFLLLAIEASLGCLHVRRNYDFHV